MAISISASVGKGGTNISSDVKTIQKAFNDISPAQGGANPKLAVDGFIGPNTLAAILAFQKAHIGLTQDSRVDRNGSTLTEINRLLDPNSVNQNPKALALSDMQVSLKWARAADAALSITFTPSVSTALEKHFHLSKGKLAQGIYLSIIRENYKRVISLYTRAGAVFRARNDAEARSDRGVDKSGIPFPAYTFFQQSINFTTSFRPYNASSNTGFGSLCRAAMVLHEPVHFVDQLANNINDIYEHSSQYDSIAPEQAVHNPSSYVCFAQQIVFGYDARFGAGKPSQ